MAGHASDYFQNGFLHDAHIQLRIVLLPKSGLNYLSFSGSKGENAKKWRQFSFSNFFHFRFSVQQPLPFDILGNYFKGALQSQLNFLKCCCGCFDKIPFCNEMPLQFTTRKIAIKRINEWNSK